MSDEEKLPARDRVDRFEARLNALASKLYEVRYDVLPAAQARTAGLEAELKELREDLQLFKRPPETLRPPTPAPAAPPPARVPPAVPRAEPAPVPRPRPVPAPPSFTPPKPIPQTPSPATAPEVRLGEAIKGAVRRQGIESFFGEKVLSRIGIVVLVFGVVFLIGYYVSTSGKIGKLLAGAVAGLGLIGTGVYVHRIPYLRSFIQPLIGGGWAILFFTAFAAHHLEVVRVIEDPLTGFALLGVVSAGMILHSLRYRSQLFTGFAYALAYVSMAISEVGILTMYAQLLLLGSLVVLGAVFRWRILMGLGMVATYGVHFVWMASNEAAVSGGFFLPSLLVLLAYGLVFKLGEILRRDADVLDLGLQWLALALNAALVSWQLAMAGHPGSLYLYFAAAGALHVAGAWRMRMLGLERAFNSGMLASFILIGLCVWNAWAERPEWIALGWMLEAAASFGLGLFLRAPLFRHVGFGFMAASLIPLGVGHPSTALVAGYLAVAVVCSTGHRLVERISGNCPEHLLWHGAAAVAGLIGLEPATLAWFWLVQSEILLLSGGLARALDMRLMAAGTYLAATAAYALAPVHGTALFVAFSATSLLNTIALGRWIPDRLREELPIWSVAAAVAAGFHFKGDPIGMFWAWMIQSQILLALRVWLNEKSLGILAQLTFAVAGIALAYSATLPLCLLYAAVATGAGAVVARREDRNPVDALAFHIPSFGVFAALYWAEPRSICLCWALYAQLLLAAGIFLRDRALQIAFTPAALLSMLSLAFSSGYGSLFGKTVSLALPHVAMWAAMAFVDSVVLAKKTAERYASILMTWAGTGFAALAAWLALDLVAIPAAWGTMAVLLVEIGVALRHPNLRLQAHLVALMSAGYLFFIDFGSEGLRIASFLLISAYLWGFYWRQREIGGDDRISKLLNRAAPLFSWIGTGLLAYVQWSHLHPTFIPLGWAALSAALLWIGIQRDRAELRWQAISMALLAVGESFFVGLIHPASRPDGLAYRTACLTATGAILLAEAWLASRVAAWEKWAPHLLAFAGAVVLGWMCHVEVDGHYLTIAWGVEGLALVAAGLAFNKPFLRYPGLAALVLCIGKIATVDLMRLAIPFRIVSFIGLGALLLGASFLYARFRFLKEKVVREDR
jgi:uncharacterized membrane protein